MLRNAVMLSVGGRHGLLTESAGRREGADAGGVRPPTRDTLAPCPSTGTVSRAGTLAGLKAIVQRTR